MPILPTVSVRALSWLVEFARRQGADVEALLPTRRLRALDLSDEDGRISATSLLGFWGRAVALTEDPALALHAAEAIDESSFGVLSYLAVTSANWHDSFERVCRYQKLLDASSRYELRRDGDVSTYRVSTLAPGADRRHLVEFSVATSFCYSQRFVAASWTPREVFFAHAPPPDTAEHERIFGVPVRFGARHNGFSFDAALLQRPMKRAEAGLSATLERLAEQLAARVPTSDDIVAQATTELSRALVGGDPGLAPLALALGMTPRTLQRRLREHETSHKLLLDEVRHQRARDLLMAGELSISEVGFLLGFSEAAAFSRAFKRWSGQTPGAFRVDATSPT